MPITSAPSTPLARKSSRYSISPLRHLGAGQQHRVATPAHERLHATHQVRIERVRDVRDEQRNRLRRLRAQAAGQAVGLVAELADGVVDQRTSRRRDLAGAVERSETSR
jgi:hypothetical protein